MDKLEREKEEEALLHKTERQIVADQEDYRQRRVERAGIHRRATLLHKLDIKAQVLVNSNFLCK